MEPKDFRELHKKLELGDSLSDAELNRLIAFYDDLVTVLDKAYLPIYTLTQREAWRHQSKLHDIRKARQKK